MPARKPPVSTEKTALSRARSAAEAADPPAAAGGRGRLHPARCRRRTRERVDQCRSVDVASSPSRSPHVWTPDALGWAARRCGASPRLAHERTHAAYAKARRLAAPSAPSRCESRARRGTCGASVASRRSAPPSRRCARGRRSASCTSVQKHLHMLVEAEDRRRMTRGMRATPKRRRRPLRGRGLSS